MSNVKRITDYAIIDHVGAMTPVELSNTYRDAYLMMGALGFNDTNCFTMKKVCQLSSPNATQVTDKQKIWVRTNKHPKVVILVCPEMTEAVKNAESLWNRNGVYVHLVVANEPEYDFGLAYHNISIYRRCAIIWGSALGWEFSAPLMREGRLQDELYIPDIQRKNRIASGVDPDALTKISSKPESYLEHKHQVATEAECKEFYEHYVWLKGYDKVDNKYIKSNRPDMLAESLDPDFELCPTCGRPINTRPLIVSDKSTVACDYCDTEIPVEQIDTFYDDSFIATDLSGSTWVCHKGSLDSSDWLA